MAPPKRYDAIDGLARAEGGGDGASLTSKGPFLPPLLEAPDFRSPRTVVTVLIPPTVAMPDIGNAKERNTGWPGPRWLAATARPFGLGDMGARPGQSHRPSVTVAVCQQILPTPVHAETSPMIASDGTRQQTKPLPPHASAASTLPSLAMKWRACTPSNDIMVHSSPCLTIGR
jgi:hypothetical protein